VNRIVRGLMEVMGHAVAGRELLVARPEDAALRRAELEAELARHTASPGAVVLVKTQYYGGSPTSDHPGARVFFTWRDPIDVLWSQYHAARRGLAAEDFAAFSDEEVFELLLGHALPLAKGALEGVLAGTPATTLVVRYERLLADVRGGAMRIAAHLGMEVPHDLAEVLAARFTFAAESGRAPGAEDATSYFRRGEAGDGRARMPAAWRDRLVAAWPDLDAVVARLDGLSSSGR
jgi:hypothetical protein